MRSRVSRSPGESRWRSQGKIDIDDFPDRGGTITHDENAIGKLHGFFNVVRNEENGFLFALPNVHQIGTHFFIRNRL
jgi:hypothetical protein